MASVRADRAHGGCMDDGQVPTKHMELILRRRSGRMTRSAVEAPAEEQAGRPGFIRLTPGWEGPFAGQQGGAIPLGANAVRGQPGQLVQ